MSKHGIAIKGTMDFESVLAFLEDVVNSFREKTVCVQRGDEFITLKPGETIDMELEAVEKKGKQKLSLELCWREEVITEGEEPFKVSCEVPEPQPEPEPEAEAEEVKPEEQAKSGPSVPPEAAKAADTKAAAAASPAAGKTATAEIPKGLGDMDAKSEPKKGGAKK